MGKNNAASSGPRSKSSRPAGVNMTRWLLAELIQRVTQESGQRRRKTVRNYDCRATCARTGKELLAWQQQQHDADQVVRLDNSVKCEYVAHWVQRIRFQVMPALLF